MQPHVSQPFQLQVYADLLQTEQDEQTAYYNRQWPNAGNCPYIQILRLVAHI